MKVRVYHALEQSSFYRLPTRRKLAKLLLITPKELRFLSTSLGLYSHFPVAKNDGSLRMVDSPCEQLKRVQRRIAFLLGRIAPPDVLFCPVRADPTSTTLGGIETAELFIRSTSKSIFQARPADVCTGSSVRS
ncbi:MAG: hypothetical protein WDN31_13195 [Hyphomicrobium sp.]